jgi:excisionase family DNA binding protein
LRARSEAATVPSRPSRELANCRRSKGTFVQLPAALPEAAQFVAEHPGGHAARVQKTHPLTGFRNESTSPVLLTAQQTADRLGVCTATVYNLCARGELAHVRVLNAVRIPKDALEEFIRLRGRA